LVLAKTEKRLAHNFHEDLRTRILICHHRSAYQKQLLFSEIHEEAEEIVLVISSQFHVRYEVRLMSELGFKHTVRLTLNMEYRRLRAMDCISPSLGYLENN
jgi:uncharacterized SAM-binding protein YcdF (DUF218 family)